MKKCKRSNQIIKTVKKFKKCNIRKFFIETLE